MITLASDFGSPYPAAMRAAIRRRSDAELLDVAHDLPRQDVRTGAFWLREVLPYCPPAVHCAVVDPGVGSGRAALVLRIGEHAIVAPDNGLALPAARRLQEPPLTAGASLRGVEPAVDASEVEARDVDREGTGHDRGGTGHEAPDIEVFEIAVEEPESSTFHGRDVFAPAAAEVHEAGVGDLESCPFLDRTDDYEDLRFPEPEFRRDADSGGDEGVDTGGADQVAAARGEVLVVDGFGNAITNVPGSVLADRDAVRVNGESVPAPDHYAAVSPGERLATAGSHGNVELSLNRGRGDEAFGLSVGDAVELRFD